MMSLHMPREKRSANVTAADAEIAFIRRDCATLCDYFDCEADLSAAVIQSMATALLGRGDWKLELATRNGRRPTKKEKSATIAMAIANGNSVGLGQFLLASVHLDEEASSSAGCYVLATPQLDREARAAIAALGPAGTSKWKLKFERPGRGFPRSPLRTELEDAHRGSKALSVYEDKEKNKVWKQIYYEMNAALRSEKKHASPTLIKRGVKKVKEARRLAARNAVKKLDD